MNKNNSPNFLLKAASYRLKIHILIYYCLIFNNGISIHYHRRYVLRIKNSNVKHISRERDSVLFYYGNTEHLIV